jgi:hypothetical protein
VDAVPALNALPRFLAPWKKAADAGFEVQKALHLKHLRRGLESPHWNWSKAFTQSKEGWGVEEVQMAYDLGLVVAPGIETAASVLQVFILAAVTQPRFLAHAQEELDRVVGDTRLPRLADKESLPYIQACVKEALRWRTVVPLDVPHAPKNDVGSGRREVHFPCPEC